MSRPAIKHRTSTTAPLRMSPMLLTDLVHRLTTRDRTVLELVWEHRVLTTHQLATIVYPSANKARHRLLELYRLRALERFQPWTATGSRPWHWVLGPAGAHVLAAQRGIDLAELGYRRTTTLAICHSRQLAHQVGANEFFAQLHAHARQTPHDASVAEWWPQRRCAALWGDLARPDAYGRWTANRPDGRVIEVDFFLEYDTGSEPLNRVTDKLAGYAALAESTGISTPVLFWLPSARREVNLRKRVDNTDVPVATAVHTPATAPAGPAGAVWLPTASTGPRLPLSELNNAWPQLVCPTSPEGMAQAP